MMSQPGHTQPNPGLLFYSHKAHDQGCRPTVGPKRGFPFAAIFEDEAVTQHCPFWACSASQVTPSMK